MPLIYDHRRYFDLKPQTQLVPLQAIRPAKPLTAHRTSIQRAEARMREAARGTRPRRAPLTVRPEGDGFVVLDGNATFGVAVDSGWPDVPVDVQETDE